MKHQVVPAAPPKPDPARQIAACLETLTAALKGDRTPDDHALAPFDTNTIQEAVVSLARERGEDALPLMRSMVDGPHAAAALEALGTMKTEAAGKLALTLSHRDPRKEVRKAAKRALYRLRSAGVPVAEPEPIPPKPMVPKNPWIPIRAWVSGIDGTGSRGLWVASQGPYTEMVLVSLILNDQIGITDCLGGPVSKRRLDEKVERLKRESTLPWIEIPPAHAQSLTAEALGRTEGTPPGQFTRLRECLALEQVSSPEPLIYGEVNPMEVAADPTLLDHSGELLQQRELAGWFLEPGEVMEHALELMQAKESRLVITESAKEERQVSILNRAIDERVTLRLRGLLARRLEEMAWIFWQTARQREARVAVATSLALADAGREARYIPFLRAMGERSLEVATEIIEGHLKAEDVSLAPRRRPAS